MRDKGSSLIWIPAFAAMTGLLNLPVFAVAKPNKSSTGLYAAAGKVDITPDLKQETIWLAGYGASGRRAKGIHDPLYARALVVSDGKRKVALVAVDSIGIFREDVLSIRRALGWDGKSAYLFLASTHDHSAPDTMGLWGRFPGFSGVDRRYHRRLLQSITGLVQELSNHLQEVGMDVAAVNVNPNHLCRDSRDPAVIDPELQVVQLLLKNRIRWKSKGLAPRVLATLVRWSCHSEVMGPDNLLVTADFPGALCRHIETSEGGTCVFFNGVIGGLLTPEIDEPGGTDHRFSEAKRVGEEVAGYALLALGAGSEHYFQGPVTFASEVVRVPVENSRYLLFLPSLTFGHVIMDEAGRPLAFWKTWWLPLRHLLFFPLPKEMRPWVETEVSRVRIGPVDILGIPGELFPELAIGGYDGRYRYRHPLINPKNENPPDLARAPKGPYLRQKIHSKHALLVGLANDELGYIIPNYDFKFTPNRSMAPMPKGDHYEETNSIGPSVADILLKGFDDLLRD